jgi:hypothetical protein
VPPTPVGDERTDLGHSTKQQRDTARRRALARRVFVNGRWIAPIPTEKHGLPSTYTYFGCRCDECRPARSAAAATSRARTARRSTEVPRYPVPVPSPIILQASPPPPPQPRPVPPEDRQDHDDEAALDAFLKTVIPTALSRIRDAEHAQALARAFHDPTFTMQQADGRQRRYHDGLFVVVSPDNGAVIFIGDADHPREIRAVEAAERAAGPRTRGQPRAKGGRGGTRRPTSYDEVLTRLAELGFTYSLSGGGHYKVLSPRGEVMPPIPATPSDWRSVANTVADYRRRGVDLTRAAS